MSEELDQIKRAAEVMEYYETLTDGELNEKMESLEQYIKTLDIVPEYMTEVLRMLQLEEKYRNDK